MTRFFIWACKQNPEHATNQTVKAFASILIGILLSLTASQASASDCGTLWTTHTCCHSPAVEITCCADPSAIPAHECGCTIQSADEEAPGILTPPPAAPRAPLTALLHTREDTTTLFRDSEKVLPRFPNLGNATPRTGAASLQIWRC